MKFFVFLFLFFSGFCFSQEQESAVFSDSLYREDHFYLGLTYNFIKNRPSTMSQYSLSSTVSLGFLRDTPFSKSRRFAVAPGVGFFHSSFRQNLVVSPMVSGSSYELIRFDEGFVSNSFSFTGVEFPVELRWRSSTPLSHKFFRIHGGFKASFLLFNRSVFITDERKISVFNNADFNKWQFCGYMVLGYNTINVFASYGLNDFFRRPVINGFEGGLRSLNVGLIFYVL